LLRWLLLWRLLLWRLALRRLPLCGRLLPLWLALLRHALLLIR